MGTSRLALKMQHQTFEITSGMVRHHRVPSERIIKTAFGMMKERHAVLPVLRSASGHLGVGESWVNFPQWAPWERVAAYEQVILPWLTGRIVTSVTKTIQELYTALLGPARQSGTIPSLVQAISGIEIALWDLAGRESGQSLSQLLFPQPHDQIAVYASGINSPLPWDLVDEHLDKGVSLFKLKLGFGTTEDRQNIIALKRHLGQHARLAVDVNRGWSFTQAKEALPFLIENEIFWLEEPLTFADEVHLAELQELSDIPLAGGENILMPPDEDTRGVATAPFDVLQPDITKYTPTHVAVELAAQGAALGKQVVPHFLGSGPGQAASLQLAAGCNSRLVEIDINRNPLRTDVYADPFEIRDGHITIPDRPGIGWSLKEP